MSNEDEEQQQIEELERAILFMKMCELRDACRHLDIPGKGQKRELITRIIARVQFATSPVKPAAATQSMQRGRQEYSLDSPIRPETYRNGAKSRAFLESEIGNHFRFTTFGMDWIKQQWAAGKSPSFREFVQFWKQEYEERRHGKQFVSKPELARVNFFRRTAELHQLTRVELEGLWKKERNTQARRAQLILAKFHRVGR